MERVKMRLHWELQQVCMHRNVTVGSNTVQTGNKPTHIRLTRGWCLNWEVIYKDTYTKMYGNNVIALPWDATIRDQPLDS